MPDRLGNVGYVERERGLKGTRAQVGYQINSASADGAKGKGRERNSATLWRLTSSPRKSAEGRAVSFAKSSPEWAASQESSACGDLKILQINCDDLRCIDRRMPASARGSLPAEVRADAL